MRKRFLSLLCALALCLGLLPVTALAAENAPTTLYVGGQVLSVVENSYWTTNENGKLTASTESGNWTVKYDPSTATLTLNGATIQGETNTGSVPFGAGIYAQCSNGQSVTLTIKLIGENTITGHYGIHVNAHQGDTIGADASLIIQSNNNGSLTVTGTVGSGLLILSGTGDASLTIENASVDAKTTQTSSGYAGVCVQSGASATDSPNISLSVDGGSLTASGTGSSDGILFYVGKFQATGATTSLTVSNNAIVDARNGGISASRISVTLPTPTPTGNKSNGIVFDGSAGTVYGSVTLQDNLEIQSGETLTVPSGAELNCNEKLTNNGTVTIENGGALTDADKVTNNGTINVEDGGKLEGTPTGGTVVKAPTITTQPADMTVTEGQTASFTVEANGDSLSYQWQQSADNGTNWNNISGATSNSYTTDAATLEMNNYQYQCVVSNSAGSVTSSAATLTVTQPVTGVTLDQTELSLYTGESKPLTAKVEPNDATNKDVTWASSNSAVATVDATGNVKAVGAGTATITVTTADGGRTATCAVTVTAPPEPEPEPTPPPYIPPTKTPSEQAIDKIEDAKEGSTVKITLRTGQTKLDKEVFEELAGRDVTLEISLPGGVTWTVNGEDIPQTADLTDLDMGVSLNTSTIPVDLINAITGEIGTVQLTLKHDGPFGFTMTLTAPVGKENEGLWANLYHYNTTKKQMLFETSAQVDSSGNVALKFTHASEYAIVLDEKSHELPFTDTAMGAWYQGAVEYVYRNGIMTGTSATTFEPGTPLSRAMVAQILYNLESQPDISEENLGYPYSDVDAEAWYGDAVYWARVNGVATGYEDNTFRPNKAVTREELAQMLYNYAQYKKIILPAMGDLSKFPDGDKVSSWAQTAMKWATGLGVINGYEDSTLRPGGSTTRAEAASMILGLAATLTK